MKNNTGCRSCKNASCSACAGRNQKQKPCPTLCPTGPTGPEGSSGATGATGPCCTGPTGATGASGEPFDCSAAKIPDWYIDAESGDDSNDGTTPETALQTWAEWKRRVGECDLDPDGGVMTINILTDLPSSDPIVIENLIVDGKRVFVLGQKILLRSGTITAAVDKDRATNTPYQITDATLPAGWSADIRNFVIAENGARAFVARDLGGNTAHMSEWVEEADPFEAVTPPAVPPTAGQTYDVYRFTEVTWSFVETGSGDSKTPPPSGLSFTNLHFVRNADLEPPSLQMTTPDVRGTAYMIISFGECRFDPLVVVKAGNYSNIIGNCVFVGAAEMGGASATFLLAGLFRPDEFGGYPGGFRAQPGSNVLMDADPTFVGEPENFIFADIQVLGFVNGGAISFWDTFHALVGFPTGFFVSEAESPLFNEEGYVPLWGNGNTDYILLFDGANFDLNHVTFDGMVHLPSLEMAEGPGGNVLTMPCGEQMAHAWQRASATYTPPLDTRWALLEVPVPAGYLDVDQTFPEGVFHCAVMTDPATGASLSWSAFIVAVP